MRHLLPVLLLAALVSCKSSTSTTIPDRLTAQTPTAETQWLVWTTSDSGPKTHLVRATPDGHETLGVFDGALVGVPEGDGARLWEFTTHTIQTKQTDCDCAMEAFNRGEEDPDCDEPAELEVGTLRPVPDGDAISIPPLDAIDSDTRAVYAGIDGTIGPYVFATVCIERYACGAAHGDQMCLQQILDLRSRHQLEPWDMAASPLRGPEMLSFVREGYDDEHEAAELAEEDVVFSWVAPRFEQSFTPRMEEQYTGPTCYACSDGLWDAYTMSVRRTVDKLPTPVAAWLKSTPAPPASFSTEVQTQIGGWSVLPPRAQLPEAGYIDRPSATKPPS